MISRKEKALIPVAAFLGATVWISISMISGETEAWDSSLYYIGGIPILIVFAFVFGLVGPNRPWVWGVAFTVLQPVVMFAQQPDMGAKIFVSILFFIIIGALFTVSSVLGAFIRNKFFCESHAN